MKFPVLIGRILFAAIFVMSAPNLLRESAVQMAAQHGVPAADYVVPLFGVIALLGGLSVLLGYHAKTGAWLLVAFLVPVTLTMHNFWAVPDPTAAQMQQIMFMKNIALLGGALFITYFGSGPLSLDEHVKHYADAHGHGKPAAHAVGGTAPH